MFITLVQLLYITRISYSTPRLLRHHTSHNGSKIPWIFDPSVTLHLTTAYDFNYFCLTFLYGVQLLSRTAISHYILMDVLKFL